MVDAFVDGARALGRNPRILSAGFVPAIDAFNQLSASVRLANDVRAAESAWVVAAAGSYGGAAAGAGRPYACWIATSLDDEWRARVDRLKPARRIAHAVNAPVLRRLERRVLEQADAVYGISPASRDALASAGRRDDVGVLPIPVDVERFRPGPDDIWESGLAEPMVVFVGRGDDPRKNAPLLLNAWETTRRELPAAHLTLVGRTPPEPLPPGVSALGEVDDVARVLRRAALFVLPSLQEGFGIVVAEALACGVPVVSTPSGGPEALLRGSGGGEVLQSFDADELASRMSGLLSDLPALRRMRSAGRAYVVEHHSPEAFRRALAAAFASLGGR